MTDARLRAIIQELRRELEAIGQAIVLMERIAGLRPRRGRPPRVRLSVVRREPRGRR
jgi:hypothetical protein